MSGAPRKRSDRFIGVPTSPPLPRWAPASPERDLASSPPPYRWQAVARSTACLRSAAPSFTENLETTLSTPARR